MKSIILPCCIFFSSMVSAQAKLYSTAVIYTTTNVIAPEEEDVQNLSNSQEPARGMNFRNMLDGETKFVTYLKDAFIKTVVKSDMGRTTIYRDVDHQNTTSVIEMMGNKNGFFTTDSEQVAMQKRRDSMMVERRKKDTSNRRVIDYDTKKMDAAFILTDETKKIAGFNCKKALVVTTKFLGLKDTAIVWFSPDIKFTHIMSTGNFNIMPGMMGNMSPTLNGIEKLDGFVMRYEMNMRRNRRMEVEVTKIELNKNIDNKEFDIPKDIELKPMKEMSNMFGGGRGGYMRGRNE